MTLALIGFVATINPAAAAFVLVRDRRGDRPRPVVGGVLAGIAALVLLAAGADTILDALEINLGTYRLGAGVVIVASGLRLLVTGPMTAVDEPETDPGLGAFVAFPTLITPGAAALAVSVGAGDGLGSVIGGVALGACLGGAALYWRRALQMAIAGGAVRLLGATSTLIGVLVAVDGVRTL